MTGAPGHRPGDGRVFGVVASLCALFVAATLVAMALYPGGAVGAPHATHYLFFDNFFSDLGQTVTHAGRSNLPSLAFFVVGVASAAAGLALFFTAFPRLVAASPAREMARAAAVLGVATAACFLGVAATPWNLHLALHNQFVLWAFRALPAAVALDTAASILDGRFPKRFPWVFGAYGILLVAYLGLITLGPPLGTPAGARIQATGQKLIVYASILTVWAQSANARRLLREPSEPERAAPIPH